MKQLEFDAVLNPDRTLAVPEEVAAQVRPGEKVRVVLVVPEAAEDREWAELTADQFLKGYAEGDAVYDQLSGG